MSDNIPFDIQIYIMKRLPVKSILRFRTVSKEWKSCIDFINFQKTYGIRSSNDCCMILRYNQSLPSYMLSFDHNLTYSPLVTVVNDSNLLLVGTCHRIWYFSYGIPSICCSLWNPSIKRYNNILVTAFNSQPKSDKILLGFSVHRDTLDPTNIKVSYPRGGHGNWFVSVFTLSSMDWKKLDNDYLPRESIRFKRSSQVVVVHDIDVVFRDGLTVPMCLSSIGNSLILSGITDETDCYLFCGWSVLVDVTSLTSFTLLFAIPTPNYVKLLGFTMDEISLPIVEVPGPYQLANSVQVLNISTQTLQNLGIQGVSSSFFIGQYKESLILLPYPDRELLRLLELWTFWNEIEVNAGILKLMLLSINLLLQLLVYAAKHILTAVSQWERQIQALVDNKKVIINETSIWSDLKLDDAEGTECLPNDIIFEHLTLMGTMTSAIICLATNQNFNFSKYIFDNMIKNLEGGVKFLMYPRFVQVFLDKQVEGMSKHNGIYVISSHTKKVFANMKREGKGFSGRVTPLFQSMMVQASKDMGEDSAAPTDSHSTPIITQPSSSKPQKKKSRRKQRKDSGPTELITKTTHQEHVSTPSCDPPQSGEDRMQLHELMNLCTKLSGRVLALENVNTSQATEIAKLKERIKNLEKKQGPKFTNLKDSTMLVVQGEWNPMKKVWVLRRMHSTRGRRLLPLTKIQKLHWLMRLRRGMMKTTTTTKTITTAQPSSKDISEGKMVTPKKPLKKKEQIALDEEYAFRLHAKEQAELERVQRERDAQEEASRAAIIEELDNIQAMIEADEQLAARLQTKEQEQFSIERKSKMLVEMIAERKRYLKNIGRYKHNQLKGMCYEEIQKLFDKIYQQVNTFVHMDSDVVEGSKKAKVDIEQESSTKRAVPEDGDDVTVDATPLSTRSPNIVDYKIYKEGKKSFFQIIRAGGVAGSFFIGQYKESLILLPYPDRELYHMLRLLELCAEVIILESDYDSPHSMNSDDTWEPGKDVAKNTSNSVSVKGRKGSTTKNVSCSKSTKTKPFKDLNFFDDSSLDDQGNVFRGVVRGKHVESDVDSVQVIILESDYDSPHSMNSDDTWEPGKDVTSHKVMSVPDVVDAKRPPPVRNCILGLASLKTREQIIQKDFGIKMPTNMLLQVKKVQVKAKGRWFTISMY
ncbi:ribonuclease H-like domain-containing protein [Tanacetum coccineum]